MSLSIIIEVICCYYCQSEVSISGTRPDSDLVCPCNTLVLLHGCMGRFI